MPVTVILASNHAFYCREGQETLKEGFTRYDSLTAQGDLCLQSERMCLCVIYSESVLRVGC